MIWTSDLNMARIVRRSSVCVVCALLGSTILWAAGCNILGPAFLLAHGPPRVSEEYTLDKHRVTTVLVDDPNTVFPRRQYRVVVSQQIEERLIDRRAVAVDMVSSQYVLALVNRETPGERRTIPQLGRDVGAEVVLWVTFDRFTLAPDGQTFRPTSVVRVKVVDAVNDTVLWPDAPAGYKMTVQMDAKTTSLPESFSARAQVELDLALYSGKAIAELFYEVEQTFSAREGN